MARARLSGAQKTWELFIDNSLAWSTTGSPPGTGLMSGPCIWNLGRVPTAFDSATNPPCLIDEFRLTVGGLRPVEEQTGPFSNEAPPTFWPGSGASWPSGAVIL